MKNFNLCCNCRLQTPGKFNDIFSSVITEEQKYFSGIFKSIGFAFLTPIGSIVFQTVVFRKDFLSSGYLWIAAIIAILSWFLFYLGYTYIKEKKQ